jgi:hypothetical protein
MPINIVPGRCIARCSNKSWVSAKSRPRIRPGSNTPISEHVHVDNLPPATVTATKQKANAAPRGANVAAAKGKPGTKPTPVAQAPKAAKPIETAANQTFGDDPHAAAADGIKLAKGKKAAKQTPAADPFDLDPSRFNSGRARAGPAHSVGSYKKGDLSIALPGLTISSRALAG